MPRYHLRHESSGSTLSPHMLMIPDSVKPVSGLAGIICKGSEG